MQNMMSDPLVLRFSVGVYRMMLRAYPRSFRGEYGEWMAQAFRDSCRRVVNDPASGNLPGFWFGVLLDYFVSVFEQHLNRGAVMTQSKWIKLSGWGLFLGGILSLSGWFASSRPAYSPYNAASWAADRWLNAAALQLIIAATVLIFMGLLGIRARFYATATGIGKLGIYLALAACLFMLIGLFGMLAEADGPWWNFSMFGSTGLFLGLALFGVDALRRKFFPGWNALPLVASIPWLVLMATALGIYAVTRRDVVLPDQALNTVVFLISFGGLSLIGLRLQALPSVDGGKASIA